MLRLVLALAVSAWVPAAGFCQVNLGNRDTAPVLPGENKPAPARRVLPVSAQVVTPATPGTPVLAPAPHAVPAYLPTTAAHPVGAVNNGHQTGCADCDRGHVHKHGHLQGSDFGARLRERIYTHICAPDGCPTPLGCGNFWTAKKFIFGGCRQFFGTAESTVGQHYGTTIP